MSFHRKRGGKLPGKQDFSMAAATEAKFHRNEPKHNL